MEEYKTYREFNYQVSHMLYALKRMGILATNLVRVRVSRVRSGKFPKTIKILICNSELRARIRIQEAN
jgi:hypothetical protein